MLMISRYTGREKGDQDESQDEDDKDKDDAENERNTRDTMGNPLAWTEGAAYASVPNLCWVAAKLTPAV